MKRLIYSRLSIRQRLPFLICLLLLSVILVFGFISYLGVRKAALKVGEDRIKTLTEQLSTMLAANSRSLITSAFTAVNKPAIKSYLLSDGRDSSAEALKILNDLRKDSSCVQVELKNKGHIQVLRSAKAGINININVDSMLHGLSSNAKIDSGKVGKLYELDSSVCYPIVVAVVDNNKQLGYATRWKKMVMTSKALEQFSQLIGTGARLLIGNADGSVWTDMRAAVPSPPLSGKNNKVAEYQAKKKRVLAYVRPIANSQWLVAVELSKNKILETANWFLFWLIIAGVVILAAGFFIAWLMSRKISEPLRKLTRAASELAAGNYSSIVQVNRHDELGKLARAFNAMAIRVRKSQKELEDRAQNYKLLFESNPMPMWIVSDETLMIIDLNEAAIDHYGYSREEFMKLKSTDLRPAEDVEKYLASISRESTAKNNRGIWRHKKKDGTVIMVDVIADDIMYQDQPARLVLANDITEKLKAEAELVSHRKMHQEIITETTIQVQEKEREELGKELHDNINQILASTKLYLEIARSGNNEMLSDAISKSYENVNLAISEIRQLSKQLVAPVLDTTLIDAIKDLTDEIQAIAPITISLATEKFNEELLNDNVRLMLYRIVQEQVNNILKHAAASEIILTVETNHGMVYLVIADNGIGFNTNKKAKGIGLRNIENRVKFYDGVVDITSQEGKGTRMEISVPLERESKLAI